MPTDWKRRDWKKRIGGTAHYRASTSLTIRGEKAPAEHPGSLGGREALICLCPPVPEPASRRDQEG